jgi:hypothetical protein
VTRTLIIRGFDDKVHEQLGNISNQRGISVNSIVKDAVDMWLNHDKLEVPRKHHLLIYSNNESIVQLIRSIDRYANDSNLFRCFFGPPGSSSTKQMIKLKWFDGTIKPYYYSFTSKYKEKLQIERQNQIRIHSEKDIVEYCDKVMENIVKHAGNKQVCCMDFLMNDVSKTSLKQTLSLEKAYDNNRISGLMYCTYETDTLFNSEIKDLINLFKIHDQIFILKEDEIYKLHITKENVHKLFLN